LCDRLRLTIGERAAIDGAVERGLRPLPSASPEAMLRTVTTRFRTLALAAPHTAAVEAGRAAFAHGGTAVDAALAACATLTVVYPHMCSIGGDAIALVHAPDGTVTAVNGSGAAPAALDAARVRAALERDPAPVTRTGMPVRGPHTVTVPGVLAAWETLRQLGGALPPARLLRPAIGFAACGCPVSRSLAATLVWEPDLFAADPGLRAVYFRDGERGAPRPLAEGEHYVQPALAASLEAIARDGVDAFYRGDLGARYVAGLRAAGSLITTDDLAAHRTELLDPLRGAAFGHEVLTAPPNSQGYVLLQLLAAMRHLTDPGDLARLFRLAGDERDAHLCDPRVHAVPLDRLLAAEHIERLAAASADRRPASPAQGVDPTHASGDTIACVGADSGGWAVSIIQSVYHGFGAAILEPSTGIVAHDRGACFSLDPASPNVVEGQKRPLHTLMPVMVRRGGRLAIVAGTMGGEAQPQIHAQILSRLLSSNEGTWGGGAGLAAAVAAPRWIVDEGALWAEADVSGDYLAALRSTGMPVELLERLDESVGHAQYIRVAEDGSLEAASDPRADGTGLVTHA
jgi:gamma-glutamyltranspeptidase/glutathione hydrolase